MTTFEFETSRSEIDLEQIFVFLRFPILCPNINSVAIYTLIIAILTYVLCIRKTSQKENYINFVYQIFSFIADLVFHYKLFKWLQIGLFMSKKLLFLNFQYLSNSNACF